MHDPVRSLSPPRMAAPTDELASLLLRLGGLTAAHVSATAAGLRLSVPVAMALYYLEPAQPAPMHALAASLRCDPSHVTWIADQLESQGFAHRQPSAYDRRVKVLQLTAAGHGMRDAVIVAMTSLPVALSHLSVSDQAALTGLLQRVLAGPEPAVIEADSRPKPAAARPGAE